MSPYFSPKSAIAPAAIASCVFFTSVCTGVLLQDLLVDDALDLEQLLARDGAEVDEVEAQPVGRDERAGLLDVRAQHLCEARRGAGESPCGCGASRRGRRVDVGRHQVARAISSPLVTWTRVQARPVRRRARRR